MASAALAPVDYLHVFQQQTLGATLARVVALQVAVGAALGPTTDAHAELVS